jgi:hypothetical protein
MLADQRLRRACLLTESFDTPIWIRKRRATCKRLIAEDVRLRITRSERNRTLPTGCG